MCTEDLCLRKKIHLNDQRQEGGFEPPFCLMRG